MSMKFPITLLQAMQYLYEHEINCSISSFWDGGWEVKIGDDMNGFKSSSQFDNAELELVADWLISETYKVYPDIEWLPHPKAALQASDLPRGGNLPSARDIRNATIDDVANRFPAGGGYVMTYDEINQAITALKDGGA